MKNLTKTFIVALLSGALLFAGMPRAEAASDAEATIIRELDDIAKKLVSPLSVTSTATIVSPTVTVSTSPAYTANDVVGGKLTLTNAMRISGGTGVLQSLCVIDKANQKAALEILIFDSDPSTGTYTDNGAYSWNATDGAKLIRRIPVAAADYTTVGTAAVADISPGGRVLRASGSANLYAVVITTGTPTYAATTDLIIRFGILQD